jgi:sugar O-acyltransferase (sialic acid O-acetyltransferase NeuD family)
MTPLILVGGGGHCRSTIDVIESTNDFEIVGVVESSTGPTEDVLGYSVIGRDNSLIELLTKWKRALITVGQITSPITRIQLYENARSANAIFPVVVSPNAYVSKYASIGGGTVVMHGVTVNVNADIGVNCIVNSQALVEHDVVVGAHSHISTGARINGGVIVGEGSFIGSGAVVHQGVTIGPYCVVAAGSIVRKDLPPGTQVRKNVQ